MIEKPKGDPEALRSPTLDSLASRVVPGSVLTVHTKRTDYRMRVAESNGNDSAQAVTIIKGMLVDAMSKADGTSKLEPGIELTFSVPSRIPGDPIHIVTADGAFFRTSRVEGYSLEPAQEADTSLETRGLADYQGERWAHRFQTETVDEKRGIQALLAILPEELRKKRNQAVSLKSAGAMDGTKSFEEYGRNEARRHAEGEELERQLGWLNVAHALLTEMVKGNVDTHWTMAAQALNLTEEQARDALDMLAQDLQAKYLDQLIGNPAKHFSQERAIGDKDPQMYEAEAQRLLGLRDAKGVLKSIIEEGKLKQP